MRHLVPYLVCGLLTGCAPAAGPPANPASPAVGFAEREVEQPHLTPPRSAEISAPTGDPALPTPSLALDPPAPTAERWPAPSGGELLYTRYPGRLIEQELPLVIYLPPGYHWASELLPAVYLLHGIGYDEQQWVELGVQRLVDRQLQSGDWEPLLLIMPLMPDPLLSSTDGGPDSYEAEFLRGLVPYVERNFRADPARSALAGISRGGVWALEIALRHPDSFRGVAALSPALHMNFPRPQYDPSVIATGAVSFPAVIYLDAGDGEPRTLAAVEDFSLLLRERGVQHVLHVGQGGHDPEYWSGVVPRALAALAAGLIER